MPVSPAVLASHEAAGGTPPRAGAIMRLATLAYFPGLLIALVLIGFVGGDEVLGPLRLTTILLLTVPAMMFWGHAGIPATLLGPALRPIAILGGVAALCLVRLDAVVTDFPPEWRRLLLAPALFMLLPAGVEWLLVARPRLLRPGWHPWLFDAAIIGVLPCLFLFTAPLQLFMPPGWVDPAMYLGIALDLEESVRAYGWNYHSLRVSFVLPNALLHMMLPPVPAQLAMVVGCYLLGIAGLYSGTRLLWDRAAAIVAAAGLAYNPVFIGAVTAGYVDGAVIAYLLAMFAALAAWSRARSRGWLVLAGALGAAAVLAHSVAVVPAGLLLLFFIVLRWDAVAVAPLRLLGAGMLGAACVWLYFVYALAKIGFGIDAFRSLRWIVTASVSGFGANYRLGLGEWLPTTTRLVPGLLVAAGLLVMVPLRGQQGLSRRDLAALIPALGSAIMLPAADIVLGGAMTQSAFYTGFVVPGIAVGFGALASLLLPMPARRRMAVTLLVTTLSILLCWQAPKLMNSAAAMPALFATPTLLVLGLLLIALLRLWRRTAMASAVLVGLMAVQSLALAVNGDTRPVFRTSDRVVRNIEFFRAALFVREQIAPGRLGGHEPLFWFDRASFATRDGRREEIARPIRFADQRLVLTAYDTFASLRLWDRAMLSPELRPGQVVDRAALLARPNATLVVMAQDGGSFEVARLTLGQSGIACRIRATAEHQSRSFELRLMLIDIVGERPAGPVACDA